MVDIYDNLKILYTKVMARTRKSGRTYRHQTAIVATMSSSPQAGSTKTILDL